MFLKRATCIKLPNIPVYSDKLFTKYPNGNLTTEISSLTRERGKEIDSRVWTGRTERGFYVQSSRTNKKKLFLYFQRIGNLWENLGSLYDAEDKMTMISIFND